MLWPQKNSYKEFDKEKKFLRLENSPPPPQKKLFSWSVPKLLTHLYITVTSRNQSCSSIVSQPRTFRAGVM